MRKVTGILLVILLVNVLIVGLAGCAPGAQPAPTATKAAAPAPTKAAAPAPKVESIVVSTWGGNWKDTLDREVSKRFTAETGIKVEYEVGGTVDRLAKARAAKGKPQVDITLTTTHMGRLYISDDLFEKLDLSKIPNSKDLFKEAVRSDYHLGVWSYVYTIVYRPDLIKENITSWADLWKPEFKGKIGLPDFDPSHIIVMSALLSGGNEFQWEKGQEKLKALKPNIAGFYATDAQSQDLLKTGNAPIEVMLSINAFHLKEQGVPVKIVDPKEKAVVGIDTVAIMKGIDPARREAAYKYINTMLDKDVQEKLAASFKCGVMNMKANLPPELKGQPGVLATPDDWKTKAYLIDDGQRAKMMSAWKEWFNREIVAK
ncbi:MAG: ABC transporter substrate-binding protein [Chloroflexi bacterium]|nr:ABC transporter substrate-binding protein [Chloroflexota bacterium]